MTMLRKDEMTPGTRLRVLPVIRTGVPAKFGATVKSHLMMTPEPGGMLDGYYNIPSGTVLTVVEPPKRRNGTNTIALRTEGGQQGYVYWCEARASCETIAPKAVRYNSDAYRIELDGEAVAIALRLGNGRWGLYDARDERKMSDRTWDKPADVANAYREMLRTMPGDATTKEEGR